MPSQVPYHTLISNCPSYFPASFNSSHCLSLAALHSNVLTLISFSLSGSCASTFDLILTTLLPTHISHGSTTALQLAPSMLQHLVKQVLLSSLILFLSSLIFSFHPFIPFIALPPSCCLSSFSSHPLHCWPLSCSPHVIKHCPTTISCVTGTTPATLKATHLLHTDHVAHPHQPYTVTPHSE